MRIALLTMHSCPLEQAGTQDTGGMNVYAMDIAKQLGLHNHQVDIFTLAHDLKEDSVIQLSPRIRLIHTNLNSIGVPKKQLINHVTSYESEIEDFRRDQQIRYDIIHSHYWLSGKAGINLSAQWDVPHVSSFHTTAALKNAAWSENQEIPERSETEKQIALEADRIITWTAQESADLQKLYQSQKTNFSIIPIGVNRDIFYPHKKSKAREHFKINPEEEIILYLGRLDPIKGANVFIDIAHKLKHRKNLRSFIVGGEANGLTQKNLALLTKDLNISERVTFLNPISHGDLPVLYSAVDMLVVPSYYESFSMVTAESMASGTPVIASNVSGPASLIDDGKTGFLVAPGDGNEFARRIEIFLDEPSLRKKIILSLPNSIAHLEWSLISEKIIKVYLEELGIRQKLKNKNLLTT